MIESPVYSAKTISCEYKYAIFTPPFVVCNHVHCVMNIKNSCFSSSILPSQRSPPSVVFFFFSSHLTLPSALL